MLKFGIISNIMADARRVAGRRLETIRGGPAFSIAWPTRPRRFTGGASPGEKAMFSKILIAVDLADPAQAPMGLAQAVELANASGGLLRLVNIQPLLPATFMEYVPVDFDAEQEKRATVALQEIVAAVQLPKERLSGVVRVGGIYHEILAEATEWGADLIVVGSHRPVVTDYLLGSNAKTIVRHAICSVLVVRP
jgi:nucleotide-binding universal stress UspA family protein